MCLISLVALQLLWSNLAGWGGWHVLSTVPLSWQRSWRLHVGRTPRLFCVGGVSFLLCTVCLLATTSLFCPQLGDSASWCSQSCMIPSWAATLIPAARWQHCSFASGGLVCVLTWLLTWQAAPRVSG